MKRIFQVCTIIFIVLIMVGITYANKDRKGSSDYPLISRMPDFRIASYKDIGNDLYTFRDSANIHEAAKKGSLEKVKAFLANGEKVDVKDKYGLTPLYLAAVEGHKDVCEYLIAQGADVNAASEFGFFPLGGIISTQTERGVEIFKLLVDHGADYDINFGGYPLLHQAVYSCNNESVKNIAEFLISKGVDINAKGYQDKTPLHMVGCRELARLLILKGADIEARDKDGLTPIFYACSTTRNLEICEFLISKGADVNAKDNRGWTPLRLVHSQCLTTRNTEICDLLKKHGGVK